MNHPIHPEQQPRHSHRRQAVRRQAQRHHWRFYKNRSDWSFIQNFARTPIRWRRESTVLGALTVLVGLLAFVVLPGWASVVEKDAVSPASLASMPLALPKMPAVAPLVEAAPAPEWRVVEIRSGQTMGDVFASLGLDSQTLHRVMSASTRAAAFTTIRPGDRFEFLLPSPGVLAGVRFDAGVDTRIELAISGDRVSETVVPRDVERRVLVSSGTITQSLFGAGEDAGLSDAMVMQLANVFAYDIDFAQDLREGDSFSLVYEEIYRDGEKLRDGNILAASFVNGGHRHVALRYTVDGVGQFFDADGRPMRKAFLRTPVEFTRISSRFSSARRHPILGLTRAHQGVDYAAPKGTPIKAAGNAKIAFRGWKSGYGNCIILQHSNQYTTLYGHMSRFAENLRVGARVAQGQTIGYVGMTGLATAPHLHYEFRINGVHRDPLSIDLPKADPLTGTQLADFRRLLKPLLAQLDLVEQRQGVLAAR
ncbi:MAG TPA: M23 family metallopeptidase [Xanthomonadales bacterium]|nr:M23 family metallopeptidase [Xanthomonadales bacterium]